MFTRAHHYHRGLFLILALFFISPQISATESEKKGWGEWLFGKPAVITKTPTVEEVLAGEKVTEEEKEKKISLSIIGSRILGQDVRVWAAPQTASSENFILCKAEEKFINTRINVVKPALIDFLAEDDAVIKEKLEKRSSLPLLAACGSGGGFRAMYSFSGALEGFERNKLLGSFIALAGLSGSTWALGPSSASGEPYEQFVGGFLNRIEKSKKNFNIDFKNVAAIAVTALKTTDIMATYTTLLQNTLFVPGAKPNISLSTLQAHLDKGQNPLPIFTAIFSPKAPNVTHLWCDMTPYEAACYKLRSAVPPERFGGVFEERICYKEKEPLLLTQILTICGSAFAVTGVENMALNKYLGINKTTNQKWSDLEVFEDLQKPIKLSDASYLSSVRYAKFVINNIAYKAVDSKKDLPFNDQPTFPIVDAGIDCNIPLHPLLQRDKTYPLDLIVVIDASGDLPDSFELLKAKLYAQQNGLRFPDISQTKYPHYKTDPFTLFGVGENAPLILYIPIAKNPIYQEIIDLYNAAWKDISPIGIDVKFSINDYKNLLAQSKDKTDKNLIQNIKDLQEKITLLRKAKFYDVQYKQEGEDAILNHTIGLINRMVAFDPVKEMNSGFMGTFNFNYNLGTQVPLVRDTFIVALYQALPVVKNALLDRIDPHLRTEHDSRLKEKREQEEKLLHEALEKEQKKQNVIFEDLTKAFNVIAD